MFVVVRYLAVVVPLSQLFARKLMLILHIAFFILKMNVAVDTRTRVMNKADVTLIYFVLIGSSHHKLGRLVLNMVYELN